MKTDETAKWSRLDNAAKIFPPTSTKRDTKVFRFACELTEPVDGEQLQRALDRTMELFPFYRSVLKRGFFWYYMEESDLKPVVEEESEPPCSTIYDRNIRRLLFHVTWFQNRINLDVYHALSDGTGALHFLRVLTYQYLLLVHASQFPLRPAIDYDASMTQKLDDSFQKYYQKSKGKAQKERFQRAWHFRGTRMPEGKLHLIEGVMPASALIEKVHEFHATPTSFCTAALMCAIRDVMPVRELKRPVVVTVPVNLRKYYPSESARNFFSVFDVKYDFQTQSGEFADVVSAVSDYFKKELTAERMGARMNKLAALEHNIFARAVPRIGKDLALKAGNLFNECEVTAALSNIGRVDMPAEFAPFIRRFDVFVSTKRLQICMCTYQDTLTLSFTSAFESSEVQKNFFRRLTGLGIPVTIITNPTDEA